METYGLFRGLTGNTHRCCECGSASHSAGLSFDVFTGLVTFEGKSVKLRPRELELLEYLMDAGNSGVSSSLIVQNMMGDPRFDQSDNHGHVNVMICSMRRAFRDAGMRITIQKGRSRDGRVCRYRLGFSVEKVAC